MQLDSHMKNVLFLEVITELVYSKNFNILFLSDMKPKEYYSYSKARKGEIINNYAKLVPIYSP